MIMFTVAHYMYITFTRYVKRCKTYALSITLMLVKLNYYGTNICTKSKDINVHTYNRPSVFQRPSVYKFHKLLKIIYTCDSHRLMTFIKLISKYYNRQFTCT